MLSETLFYVWRSCVIGNFVLCLEVLCNRKLCFMFGVLVLSETLFYVCRSCVIGNFVLCLDVLCYRKLCFMFGGLVL